MYGTKSADSTLEGRGKAERDEAGKVGEEEPSEYSTEMTAVDGPCTVAFQTTFAYSCLEHTHPCISTLQYMPRTYGSLQNLTRYLSNFNAPLSIPFFFPVTLFSTSISLTPFLIRTAVPAHHFTTECYIVCYTRCTWIGRQLMDRTHSGATQKLTCIWRGGLA